MDIRAHLHLPFIRTTILFARWTDASNGTNHRRRICSLDSQSPNRLTNDTYPKFNGVIYTLENSLPIFKLGQNDTWAPDPHYSPLSWFPGRSCLLGMDRLAFQLCVPVGATDVSEPLRMVPGDRPLDSPSPIGSSPSCGRLGFVLKQPAFANECDGSVESVGRWTRRIGWACPRSGSKSPARLF